MMPGPVFIYSIPDKAVFSHREAARYVGQSPNTFTRTVRGNNIPVYWQRNRKAYKICDLDKYIANLPEYTQKSESPSERRSFECKKVAG